LELTNYLQVISVRQLPKFLQPEVSLPNTSSRIHFMSLKSSNLPILLRTTFQSIGDIFFKNDGKQWISITQTATGTSLWYSGQSS
jgi:hypothetical protein